jgi:hypothetical protein
MFLKLIDEIVNCFGAAIAEIQNQESTVEISPPICKEDDEAELVPLFDDYDDIPF